MSITQLSNKANREVCNIDIVDFKTGAPYMHYEFANTTGLNVTSDMVYAMAHGTRKIGFQNPMEGEVTITAQVLPHKVFALYSDGVIDTKGKYFVTKSLAATEAGKLNITVTGGTVIAGSVFVYAEGQYGETPIAGTFANGIFTATAASDIVANSTYEVGFMVSRTTGVQTVVLNNKRLPKDVAIYMDTFDKDTEGNLIPYRIAIKKATINRNLDLSFSSEGDPQEISLTFSVLEQDRDNFIDLMEITEEITVTNAAGE